MCYWEGLCSLKVAFKLIQDNNIKNWCNFRFRWSCNSWRELKFAWEGIELLSTRSWPSGIKWNQLTQSKGIRLKMNQLNEWVILNQRHPSYHCLDNRSPWYFWHESELRPHHHLQFARDTESSLSAHPVILLLRACLILILMLCLIA